MSFIRKAYYFLIGFFYFTTLYVSAQDQKLADSLSIIYQEDKLEGSEKLELLRNLSFNEVNDLDLSISYADELISLSSLNNNYLYLHRGYQQKGNSNKLQGNLKMALDAFFKSGEAAIKAVYIAGEGSAYISIAVTYSEMENFKNAEIYFNKGIDLLRKTTDSIALASALLNAGDTYFNNKKYEAALHNFEESGLIFRRSNYLIGTAYNKGNVGMVYAEQGKDVLAEKNINEAITILEELQDYYPISVYLTYMADIYLRKNAINTAFNYAKRSLELAQKHGLKDQISEANLKLSELYEKAGNPVASYKHYKDHIAYRDTVVNIKEIQQMADLRTNYEVSQKQTEVDLLEKESEIQQLKEKRQKQIIYATVIVSVLIFLLALGLYRRNKFIQKTKEIIEEEKNRSDKLLLNILPEETAEELKLNGRVQAKKFNAVTVLFTDFVGFTQYSENLSPEALVNTIGFYFSKFDEITEKYGLEKIKTIGDAYMFAGGLPFPTEDHASKTVKAALEITEFVDSTKKNRKAIEMTFDIRIGINTGPVVAGVVGTKKFAYDIWGDTVNIAARMESNSEAGKINVSENTYELVKNDFDCDYRGEIDVKNKGMMKMYFVKSKKENGLSELL